MKTTFYALRTHKSLQISFNAKPIQPKHNTTSINELTTLSHSIKQATQTLLGTAWEPDNQILGYINEEYNRYPEKALVNRSNLTTPEGQAFLREALLQLSNDYSRIHYTDPRGDIIARLHSKLIGMQSPLTFMYDTHKHMLVTIKELSTITTLTNESFIKRIREVSNITKFRWTKWQQAGDELIFEKGHKAIYQAWSITMPELSKLHQSVEALIHLLHRASFPDANHTEFSKAIAELSKTILRNGTLEKMSHETGQFNNSDIPAKEEAYNTAWRKLRLAKGARDNDLLDKLYKKFDL